MTRLFLMAALLFAAPIRRAEAQSYIKFNGVTALLGVPSVGYERVTGERTSFQFDVTVSPWRSVGGAPLLFMMLVPEWRYHRKPGHTGLYVGAHLGATVFKVQKWNYRNTEFYQEGFGFILGGTVGYKKPLGDRWMLDTFFGGGTAQSLYKGYSMVTGERYDGAKLWNVSGEWVPYRGGVMIAYRPR